MVQMNERPSLVERDNSIKAGVRRVGLLGAGYIAEWHAREIASIPRVELVAICDTSVHRAGTLARAYGVRGIYGSLQAMLASERLDAVHVLLPPDLHARAAETSLAGGAHVFLEKPMCTSAAECEALQRSADGRGLRVGVGHNFLFSGPYVRLRDDVRSGILGRLDHVTVTWNWELPQARQGPFDGWMMRHPRNIMFEIGSHVAAQVIDLVGMPESLEVRAGNPIDLPIGVPFYRRWQASGARGHTAVDLRFSFVPGFGERTIHVRGSLASATVDLDRDIYMLWRHSPADEDFDRYRMVAGQARSLRAQARRTLSRYALSKLRLARRGNPYGASIAGAMESFYASLPGPLEERIDGHRGTDVVRLCERLAAAATAREDVSGRASAVEAVKRREAPRILVLGAAGFIGQEVVRQLLASGRPVRLLVRSPTKLPPDLREAGVDVIHGDAGSDDDLVRSLAGVESVLHLARSNVKSWADYQRYEIDATRRIAERAVAEGVRRFVYTGTIDSLYTGARAGTIDDETPLDPAIRRRNSYARAKAESEKLLVRLWREQGLPLVVARPGIVLGRGGTPFHWGIGMWRHGGAVCEIWGDGQSKLPLVLVEDVAKGLVAALDAPGIEGSAFNLVGDPCLTAQEYLDELDRCAGMTVQRCRRPIWRFYFEDVAKWGVKTLVRHPDRRLPSYRDWESRTQRAVFDCSGAKRRLGWAPVTDRAEFIRLGIEVPTLETFR